MRVNQACRGLLAGALALAACIGLVGRASAVPVVYDIDPSLSVITLVVTALPVTPQIAGADVDAVDGTLSADLTAGVLTFSGGSVIDWVLNPAAAALPAGAFNLAGSFAPSPAALAPGFIIGTEDNYGVSAGAFGPVALRDLSADITAGTASDGAVPAGMSGVFLSGSLDNLGIDATPSIAGDAWANTTAGVVSLSTVGNVETLVLPVVFGTGSTASFGTIVATRQIPEPSTVALAALGAVITALGVWRKHRATC